MNKNIYCAGIVSYNSDLDALTKTISSLYNQLDLIIISDNGSSNQKDLINKTREFQNVVIIQNHDNLGIATALNQIMTLADEKGFEWVLTLDQDSIIDADYISKLTEDISLNEAAIYCPKVWDRNKSEFIIDSKETDGFVTKCITSGSLTNIEAWKKIGKYDEVLFIDGVDFDFCDRILQGGYRIKQRQNLILNHAIGRSETHKFLFLKFNIQNHNAMRKYYMARNRIYCDYKKYGHYTIKSFASCGKHLFKIFFFEENKKEKLDAVCRGIKDSFKLVEEFKTKNN